MWSPTTTQNSNNQRLRVSTSSQLSFKLKLGGLTNSNAENQNLKSDWIFVKNWVQDRSLKSRVFIGLFYWPNIRYWSNIFDLWAGGVTLWSWSHWGQIRCEEGLLVGVVCYLTISSLFKSNVAVFHYSWSRFVCCCVGTSRLHVWATLT